MLIFSHRLLPACLHTSPNLSLPLSLNQQLTTGANVGVKQGCTIARHPDKAQGPPMRHQQRGAALGKSNRNLIATSRPGNASSSSASAARPVHHHSLSPSLYMGRRFTAKPQAADQPKHARNVGRTFAAKPLSRPKHRSPAKLSMPGTWANAHSQTVHRWPSLAKRCPALEFPICVCAMGVVTYHSIGRWEPTVPKLAVRTLCNSRAFGRAWGGVVGGWLL